MKTLLRERILDSQLTLDLNGVVKNENGEYKVSNIKLKNVQSTGLGEGQVNAKVEKAPTKKTQKVNLQTVVVDGKKVRMSTKEIKSLNK